MWVKALFMIH